MVNIENMSVEPQDDHETWREENTRKQMAGEEFDYNYGGDIGWKKQWCHFHYASDTKERFRLHDDNAWREEYRKKQAAGVKFENYDGNFWWGMWCKFSGNKEDYREVQEAAKPIIDTDDNESDARIPEAAREVLKVWHKNGLTFTHQGDIEKIPELGFIDPVNVYSIPEQPIPDGNVLHGDD